MSKEAMTLALEALKYDADYDTSVTLQKAAIYALENAIADAEKQEPYADVVSHWHYWMAEADKYRFALQNLEEALAKQEQGKPVAWINWCAATGKRSVSFECESELASQPLYFGVTQITQKRYSNQKPLTDEEIVAINDKHYNIAYRDFDADIAIAREIEAAHGIKENT